MNCPKCGLPPELCVCDEMARHSQKMRVRTVKRSYGKVVTIVDGFDNVDIDKIAKDLKRKLACGGTSKNNTVELQGDHTSKVKKVLMGMGFAEDMIDVT